MPLINILEEDPIESEDEDDTGVSSRPKLIDNDKPDSKRKSIMSLVTFKPGKRKTKIAAFNPIKVKKITPSEKSKSCLSHNKVRGSKEL